MAKATALYNAETQKFNLAAIMELAHHWAREEITYAYNAASAQRVHALATGNPEPVIPNYAATFAAALAGAWELARDEAATDPLPPATVAKIAELESEAKFYNVVSIDGGARNRDNAKIALANITTEIAALREAA